METMKGEDGTMFIKRCTVIVLSLIVVLISVLAACAGPAPTPTLTQTTTPTPTTTPTGPLAQIIAGAKKEGTVSVQLKETLTPKSIERLESEIKGKFGVDLDIKFLPGQELKLVADALMEKQAGVAPTYDVNSLSGALVQANQAGILEKVDWKPLLLEGTNPEVVVEQPVLLGAIVYYTANTSLMYNPEKVPADKVPKTLIELADPKWQGKVGIMEYPSAWARRAFLLGKEKTLADLRAVLKNKAIRGTYMVIYNRYLLGEVWMCYITSSYLKSAQDKGMPAEWQGLDYSDVRDFSIVVRKGAPHPNAANLVGIYLASPEGARFMLEEGAAGSTYYPGNFEHDIRLRTKQQGIPEIFAARDPQMIAFEASDEFVQWQKEIDLVLKGG